MPVIPTLPTDNLYKFFALFGLVILVFGIAFPADKLARAWAQVDDADKARGIAQIQIRRKLAQMQDATSQINKKAAEINKAQKQLQDVAAQLEARRE